MLLVDLVLKRRCIRVYTFQLPPNADGSPGKLGLPIGKHVQVAFHAKNGVVLRPYTPIR
jgi:nitrate reductase (NAD(P)H)